MLRGRKRAVWLHYIYRLFKNRRPSLQLTCQGAIENAHKDDIHGMIATRDSLITGSKDTTVKMWSIADGELTRAISVPKAQGYKSWITALASFGHGRWGYGTRDGNITVFNEKGPLSKMSHTVPSDVELNCKERNRDRISCLVEKYSTAQNTHFYAGVARCIQLWDARKGEKIGEYRASFNKWIYCIEKLPSNRLAIVYGPTMQVWKMPASNLLKPERRDNLIEAPRTIAPNQPVEHISSITTVNNRTQIACAVFDGSVRIVDIASRTTVTRYQEHEKRVWKVVKLEENILASCADDQTIKLWDIREPQSIVTVVGGAGRVSNLLVLSPTTLFSTSCPDDLSTAQERASISRWEIRKIEKS